METSLIENEEYEPPSTCSVPEPARASGNTLQIRRGEGNLLTLKRPPRFHAGEKTKTFRKRYVPHTPASEWNDRRWQIGHRLKHVQDLERILFLTEEERAVLRLSRTTLTMAVTPYYMYQCDPIIGSAHFRTPVEKGIEIVKGLRGHTTGYDVPNYVIDAPGGGGKIPVVPECQVGRDGDDLLLRNYEGNAYRYHDPR